jgi:hypothetical protein
MTETVIAVYDTMNMAYAAVQDLTESGFDRSNISVASRDYNHADWTDGDVSGAEGSAFGAIIGGLTGIVMGLTAITVPGIGAIIAAGPLAAALGAATGGAIGAVAGAATGGLVASLIDLGIPEEDAESYAEHVRRGGALVTVTLTEENRIPAAIDILRRYDPVDIDRRSSTWKSTGWSGFDTTAEPYKASDWTKEREHYTPVEEVDDDTAIRRYPIDRH